LVKNVSTFVYLCIYVLHTIKVQIMKVISKIIVMIMVKTHSKELLYAHHCVLFFLGGAFFNFNNVNTIHEWFQHKSISYFVKILKNTFTTCAKILIIIIKSNSEMFCLFKFKLAISQTKECDSLDTLRLFHKDNKILFIVLYKYYVPKKLELKNQLPKLRFEI
jgi:hypothetical protein